MEPIRQAPPMPIPTLYLRNGCLLTALVLAVGIAKANPTAPIVVSGSANLQNQGNTLTVANAPGAIINWQSFSIGAGATSRFVQQSPASAVLNPVSGTVIFGRLVSNGATFLISPNGTPYTPVARAVQVSSEMTTPQSILAPIQTSPLASASAPQSVTKRTTPQGGAAAIQLAKRDVGF